MPQDLRTRHPAAAKVPATTAGNVLHALEDVQARLHSDPNDEPDTPPAKDPRQSRARTLSWDEIPGWQKDNEFILTGYRRQVLGSQSGSGGPPGASETVLTGGALAGYRTAGLDARTLSLGVRTSCRPPVPALTLLTRFLIFFNTDLHNETGAESVAW